MPASPAAPIQTAADQGAEANPWTARVVALVVATVVLGLLSLFLWGLGKRSLGTVGTAPVAARPAPAFTLPLFDGGTFELAQASGKPLLINFWASWCVPCEDEAAALERGSRRYTGRVAFLGIDVQDTEPNARAFLRRFGVTYPNGRDASGDIAVEYGMSGVPETYLIDRDGRLAHKWQGPLDDARLDALLEPLLE
ncbi:MAG: TlpA family protein disulfide reductase [Chloroflexi bacterium]|nr:TlpA family protein disulfide reductase [Chloroflexota bacterium]